MNRDRLVERGESSREGIVGQSDLMEGDVKKMESEKQKRQEKNDEKSEKKDAQRSF